MPSDRDYRIMQQIARGFDTSPVICHKIATDQSKVNHSLLRLERNGYMEMVGKKKVFNERLKKNRSYYKYRLTEKGYQEITEGKCIQIQAH